MLKFAAFKRVISPEVGTELAGYGAHDVSERKHDDLFVSGLALDDGKTRVLMLSFDLLGLDAEWVRKIRRSAADILQVPEKNVILSCTHTHQGPHTRSMDGRPLNLDYLEKLVPVVGEGVRSLAGTFAECDAYFYSLPVPVNLNRRVVSPDNCCTYLPRRKHLRALADGPVDPELGLLILAAPGSRKPLEVVVNYAAHPLASHGPGLDGRTISADYPGALRKLVAEETGADCVFVSGACGDQFPECYEGGFAAMRKFAETLASAVLEGIDDAFRNAERFRLKDPELRTMIAPLALKVRDADHPEEEFHEGPLPAYPGVTEFPAELQLLAVGDLCFVGVPGELVGEIGLEIKWHSPFRRTWILYNSTAYLSYICHANAFVSGGYESGTSHIDPRGGLKLLNTAIDALWELCDPADLPQ